ncbi:PEP/pyruvate-binding domain-containing protein [Actinomadura sp. NPDC047616]|uniref:PEP/pyruvate-binding domain-containing protein n=1 Tax=Actinomadura sp. NPDC047616 TaxID=3155914 RepID=UPI0033ED6D3C
MHEVSEVAAAVRACWASVFSPRAIDGRDASRRSDQPPNDPLMAVIVQRHLNAEVSGIMFTPADPGDTTEIEASWGLGPASSGARSPLTPTASLKAGRLRAPSRTNGPASTGTARSSSPATCPPVCGTARRATPRPRPGSPSWARRSLPPSADAETSSGRSSTAASGSASTAGHRRTPTATAALRQRTLTGTPGSRRTVQGWDRWRLSSS